MTAEIRINIQAVINNIKRIQELTDKKIIFVVKGEVYGLGYPLIHYLDQYVDLYATSSVNEFFCVKQQTDKQVLILSPVSGNQVVNDDQIIYSVSSIDQLNDYKGNKVHNINCAIKVNTGLNRYGFDYRSRLSEPLSIIQDDLKSEVSDIYTHLAASTSATEAEQTVSLQFDRLTSCIAANGLSQLDIHYTDSAALVKQMDLSTTTSVRTGMTILGLNPIFQQNYAFDYQFPISINCTPTCRSFVEQGGFYGYEKRTKENINTMAINIGYCDGIRKSWIGYDIFQSGETPIKLLDVAMNSSILQIPESILNTIQLFHTKFSLVDSQEKLSYLADLAKTSIEDIICGFNSINIDKVYY